MSSSSGRLNTTCPENISPWSSDGMIETVKKKSILINPEYKRGSSKATIQWEESVKGQRLEERMKLEKRNRLHALGHLIAHGSKWSYIQEFVSKLRAEENKILKSVSEEDSLGRLSPRGIDSLVRELWHGMMQRIVIKGVDLTLDQQVHLEIMKSKIKSENDKYLKGHPELDILLSLVYRKLLRTKPDDPKVVVANYVHYLNTNREELVLDELDVPFDRTPEEAEEPIEDMVDERQKIEAFVRELVKKCAETASCGSAGVNVTTIIDSIIENIDSPFDKDTLSSLMSAENVAKEILMSMLTSVARARTKSVEIVVEEVLESVFERVCPTQNRDSVDSLEMRGSVESFVRSLLKTVAEKVSREARLKDRSDTHENNILGEESFEDEEHDILSITSKSILKKLNTSQLRRGNSSNRVSEKPEFKSKVKFQSVSLPGTPSQVSDFLDS